MRFQRILSGVFIFCLFFLMLRCGGGGGGGSGGSPSTVGGGGVVGVSPVEVSSMDVVLEDALQGEEYKVFVLDRDENVISEGNANHNHASLSFSSPKDQYFRLRAEKIIGAGEEEKVFEGVSFSSKGKAVTASLTKVSTVAYYLSVFLKGSSFESSASTARIISLVSRSEIIDGAFDEIREAGTRVVHLMEIDDDVRSAQR